MSAHLTTKADVMAYIQEHPGQTRQQIAIGLRRPFASTTSHVSALARAGLLERQQCGKRVQFTAGPAC